MAFVNIARNFTLASSLWPGITRGISSSNVLLIVNVPEDKLYEPRSLKAKKKLPAPHTPVKYPTGWNYPKHALSEEYVEKYEPPKLLMVRRVAPLSGRPEWERYLLTRLRLHENTEDIVIVKNSPTMNLDLFKVKHLIEVKPITFPNGLPEPGDYSGTYLKKNGEFIVNKKLKVEQKALKFPDEYAKKRLDDTYLRDHLRLKWQQKLIYWMSSRNMYSFFICE
uniref:Large ribosomal subunit protein uL30m n=1 Tax=Strigamia maritima TaxID=126957 RepID=T1J3G7_STRMM